MSQDVLRLEQRVTHAEEVELRGRRRLVERTGHRLMGTLKKGLNLNKTDSFLPKKSKSRLKVHKMDLWPKD